MAASTWQCQSLQLLLNLGQPAFAGDPQLRLAEFHRTRVTNVVGRRSAHPFSTCGQRGGLAPKQPACWPLVSGGAADSALACAAVAARISVRRRRRGGVQRHAGASSPNPWDVLKLGARATKTEIKKAFNTLLGLWHPDKHPDKELAKEKTRQLVEARDAMLGMACDDRPTNYLFVGNPGSGKSTCLNSLIGERIFKSGVSFGHGMTFKFDVHKDGRNTYMDTPGLADSSMRVQAAQAITEALKQDGYYKIFFVITLEAGRLRPQDKATMQLVLDSAPIDKYGIIINKLSKKVMNYVVHNPEKEDPSPRDKILAELWKGVERKTSHIHPVQQCPDLEDENNAVFEQSDFAHVREFIEGMPPIHIAKQDVRDIPHEEFDALTQKFEKMCEELRRSNDALKDELEKNRERQKELEASTANLKKQLEEAQSSRGGCAIL